MLHFLIKRFYVLTLYRPVAVRTYYPLTARSAADRLRHRLGFGLNWTSESHMVESKIIRALEIIRVKKILPNVVL